MWRGATCHICSGWSSRPKREGGVMLGLDGNAAHMLFLTLLLSPSRLLHTQKFDAVLVFVSAQRLGEKVCTVLRAGDMRSADSLRPYEVTNEVPLDVDMFGSIMKHRVVR